MTDDKILITPAGAQKFQEELRYLRSDERPKMVDTVAWAAANGDRSENADYHYGKKKLRQIDGRIHFLSKRLDVIEIVDPSKIKADDVRFGATVTYINQDDEEKRFAIVGQDESDVESGRISWTSPLGRALLRKKVGDYFTFNSPKGEQDIEILKIEYLEINY